MANSSFDFFRKHTKVAVVLLGTLCIMAFVVADPLMQWMQKAQMGGSQKNRGQVAVSWQGGKLTEGDLSTLVMKRQILASFLRNVETDGYYQAVQAGVPAEVGTTVAPLNLATTRERNVEQDVLQTKIFVEKARQAGMVVSDETIVTYLEALGRGFVTREQMRDRIGRIQLGNGRATPEFMFGLLREALLARDYVASYAFSRATVLPQQRWEDWLKVNDRVVIEAAQLPAADFVSEIVDPTEEQIKEYYDEFKAAVPGVAFVHNTSLPSPTPGFRKPAMVKVQYMKTDFAKATEAALSEITDEQVAEYYEENKGLYIKSDFDLVDDLESEIEAATEEQGDSEEEPEEEPTDDATAEESETPSEESGDETGEQPAETDSSDARRSSPFRLAALQEPAEEPVTEEPVTEEPDAGESEPAAETPEESADPMQEFMDAGDDAAVEDSSTPDESGESITEQGDTEEEEKPVEYQPLEEVKDEIRERLAEQKAAVDLQQRLNDLLGILKNDYNGHFTARIDAEAAKQPVPEPPAALVDWDKLAGDNGLEFGESELLTFSDFRESPLGELRQPVDQASYPLSLSVQLFRKDGLDKYEPAYAFDLEQNQYLVMKIEYQPEVTPELADIRDQVVAAWKLNKAADLALAKAKELAKQAEESGTSLSQFFADNDSVKVEESDRFGWFEPFTVSQYGDQDLRLGDPGSIDGAGPDFMETVFSLGPNKIGAALENGRTNAYVIRVAMRESSPEELRENFLRDWSDPRLRRANNRKYISQVAHAVFYDLIGGEEPDWKRLPDQPRTEEEG